MLRGRTIIALLVVLALAAGVANADAAGTLATTGSSVTRVASLESVLLQQINAMRAGKGLPQLVRSQPLTDAALAHSRSMATVGFFSHDSQNGTTFSIRLERFYAPRSDAWSVAENIAMFGGGAPTAEAIVAAWMASPGHRAVLVKSLFREAGIAVVHNPAAGGVFAGRPTWVVTLDVGRR